MRRFRREVSILSLSGLVIASTLGFILFGGDSTPTSRSLPQFQVHILPRVESTETARRKAHAESKIVAVEGELRLPISPHDTMIFPVIGEALPENLFHVGFHDEWGQPIVGARVIVHRRSSFYLSNDRDLVARAEANFNESSYLYTDENGQLPPIEDEIGTIVEVEIIADGVARKRYRLVDPGRRLHYRAGRGAQLRGVVRDSETLVPLSGVTISVHDGSGLGRETKTNALGEYAFDGLASGEATLRVLDPQYQRAVRWMRLESANRSQIDLELKPGRILIAKVISADGEALSGVGVRLLEVDSQPMLTAGRLESADNGEAIFGALREERRYLVEAVDPQWGSARQVVRFTETGEDTIALTLTLEPTWVFNGKLGSKGELVNSGATVMLEGRPVEGQGEIHRREIIVDDPDGHFSIDGLLGGYEYDVLVYHPQFALDLTFGVSEASAESGLESQIELEPRRSFGGQIVGESGQPIPFATVFVMLRDLESGNVSDRIGTDFVIQTDAQGRYRLDSLPRTPGLHVLLQARNNQNHSVSGHREFKLDDIESFGVIEANRRD